MGTFDVDLFVIGAGSGGVRAARIAATHGAKVAIAESDRFGGTCVIRGCVPKKLFVYASRFADAFEDARGFGWQVSQPTFDWPTLLAAKDKEIARLEGVYRANLERSGVTIHHERAELADANTIKFAQSGKSISAEKILIATGGRPFVPDGFQGREHVITSDEAFHLEALPERIVIYGGGYIALEFAGIFANLGVETTVIYRGEKVLRGFDEDLRDSLTESYEKRGITIRTETLIERVENTDGARKAVLSNGSELIADQVMFAVGRRPNIAGLGLETAGVKLADNGRIVVDHEFRTSVDNIFAVGDVCDHINLTPVAIRDGHAFADTQFGKIPRGIDYDMIPTAVFSSPEIGTVGHTEHRARAKYNNVKIFKSHFRPMKATLSGRDEKMLMKLIVDTASDRVVGCHIHGEDAAEICQMAAIAMRMGATKADFDATMALHPSAAEELVTMATPFTG